VDVWVVSVDVERERVGLSLVPVNASGEKMSSGEKM
jgi:transcriptional accessory protein Tex/SPT6